MPAGQACWQAEMTMESHTAPAHHFGDMRGLLTSLAEEGFEAYLPWEGLFGSAMVPPGTRVAVAAALAALRSVRAFKGDMGSLAKAA